MEKELREAVRGLCEGYPDEYWQELDRERAYPEEFVRELTEAGFLSVLIPEEYGGAGLGMREACVILEEINRSGGNAAACHAQMYTMGTVLRHGSEEQKRKWLPGIAEGGLRLQAFGVTEPDAGSDTTSISTFAEKRGTATSSTGRRSSSPGSSTPTSWCSWPAPPARRRWRRGPSGSASSWWTSGRPGTRCGSGPWRR